VAREARDFRCQPGYIPGTAPTPQSVHSFINQLRRIYSTDGLPPLTRGDDDSSLPPAGTELMPLNTEAMMTDYQSDLTATGHPQYPLGYMTPAQPQRYTDGPRMDGLPGLASIADLRRRVLSRSFSSGYGHLGPQPLGPHTSYLPSSDQGSSQQASKPRYTPRILMTTKTARSGVPMVDFVPCLPRFTDGSGYVWSNGDPADVSASREYSTGLAAKLQQDYLSWASDLGMPPRDRHSMAVFAVEKNTEAARAAQGGCIAHFYVPGQQDETITDLTADTPDCADTDVALRLPMLAQEVVGDYQGRYTTAMCKDREVYPVAVKGAA
jgi:hypothetical protein